MVLITKNPKLLALVRRAYARAQAKEDEILVVWNARITLNSTLIVMESACPIYLDKVIEQLRIFTGEKPTPPGHFLWVRARGNPARRWSLAKSSETRAAAP